MRKKTGILLAGAALALLSCGRAEAGIITTFYGDDDGFGVGQVSGTLSAPTTSHQDPGEAAFTDQSLIGGGFPAYPAFQPTGSFEPFVIPGGETITSATLTMKTGSWDAGPNPVDGPGTNQVYLDGMLVDPTFISSFSMNNTDNIEIQSISLPSSFFSSFSDGVVSLNGTHLSEASGSGIFQVDFLSLEIETLAVSPAPEPTTYAMFGLGLLALVVVARKRKLAGGEPAPTA